MNIYEARWNNAVRIAETFNNLIDDGYIITDGDGVISGKFEITEDEIALKTSPTTCIVYFINDPGMDNGMHDTIEEYTKYFNDWIAIPKKAHSKFLNFVV